MMKAKGMPARFWGEAVTTTVFILNRSPTKAPMGKMPFEAWYGHKPSVSFLQTFDIIGHVRKAKPVLTKLEDRSTPMVLLGYAECNTLDVTLYSFLLKHCMSIILMCKCV